LEFGDVGFVQGGKPENPEKNPQPRSKARTNNKLNPHVTPGPESNPSHIERRLSHREALSPLRHPFSP